MTVESSLMEIAARIIDLRRGQITISPAWVATEAMYVIDPERLGPDLEYFGCHLQLRQIARQLLRQRFEPDDQRLSAQHELWPDLQPRYPKANSAKTEEPEYVLLEHMTSEDIDYNVARLRNEANAKLRHADALEAFGRSRPGGMAA